MESFHGLLLHSKLRHNTTRRAAYLSWRLLWPYLWIISSPVAGGRQSLYADEAQLNVISAQEAPRATRLSQVIISLPTSLHPQAGPQAFNPLSDPGQARAHLFDVPRSGASNERRRLIVPGSAPPSCVSRCNKCTPCKPVHVPIKPGRNSVGLMAYYPEAWRCKCNGQLFMP